MTNLSYDISDLPKIMIILERKFLKETKKIDVCHTDIECDTDYMITYLKIHNLWRIYNNMPDSNKFKASYYGMLMHELIQVRHIWYFEGEFDKNDS